MQTLGIDTILRALDVALDRRKAAFAIGGLFLATVIGGFFGYIGAEVDSAFISGIFLLLAFIEGWVIGTLLSGALARMCYLELTNETRVGWQAALGYSLNHWSTFLFSPFALFLGILAIVLVELILLFLGRIPYLGELWVALIFAPLLIINLFLTLLAYLGGWLIPPVVAAEGGGVLNTLRRVQEMIRRSPGRILAYASIAVIIVLLATLVIVPLAYLAVSVTLGATAVALGMERSSELLSAIPGVLGLFVAPNLFGIPFGFFGRGRIPITMRLAGLIVTVTVALVPLVILAEIFVVFPVACACAVYLNVRGVQTAPETREPTPAAPAAPTPPAQPPQVAEPAEAERATFCIRCGAELPEGTRFCLQCGAPQEPTSGA